MPWGRPLRRSLPISPAFEPDEARDIAGAMRTVFALCWLIIVSGIAFYALVGVAHH
jgi:hypothetical protein